MKTAWKVLRRSVAFFVQDDCFSSGAAIAFYSAFSLPSLFVIVLSVAGLFGVSGEQLNRLAQSQSGLPLMQSFSRSGQAEIAAPSGNETVLSRGEEAAASAAPIRGPVGQVAGVVILLFSATAVLAQLQYSLNRAWEVEPDPQQGGVKNFLLKRIISLGLVLVIAFLLLTSLVLTTLIDQLTQYLHGAAPESLVGMVARILNEAVTFALATALFSAIYKILPDADMKWRDVVVGGAIISALFVLGRWAVSWYLRHASVASGWDQAAGSVIVVLAWVYYSSLIVLFGAEISQVWINQFGEGIQPQDGAVRTVRRKQYLRSDAPQRR